VIVAAVLARRVDDATRRTMQSSPLPDRQGSEPISEDVGLGLMRHAHTEFKYLARFPWSVHIADRREEEPGELPW
jgi:hypothetical protein